MDNQIVIKIYEWGNGAANVSAYLGFFSLFVIVALNLKNESKRHVLTWSLFSVSLLSPLTYFLTKISLLRITESNFVMPLPELWWVWLATFVGGILVAMLWLRFVPRYLNKAAAKITKSNDLERNRKTDIREIAKFLPNTIHQFNPNDYINKQEKS